MIVFVHYNRELNDKLVVFVSFFEFTFDLHCIIIRVFDTEFEHCAETDSEFLEVAHDLIWQLASAEVDFDFFIPFAGCEDI